jgi:hypothetical protein
MTFKNIRILLLLLVLFVVALQTGLTHMRSTDWERPLWVVIYPINGDGSQRSADYIARLREEDFNDIAAFFTREAKRYHLALDEPFTVKLSAPLASQPPLPPRDGNTLAVILWSLKLRYWSWSHDNWNGPKPDIQMFVRYFDPSSSPRLAHSLGLQKGMLGVVNAFAHRKMSGSNNVVIAHELLHTVGATDKYNLKTHQPFYPLGFAEPERDPLYPQRWAELMAGRIPLSETKAVTPDSLDYVLIGKATAIEIRWSDDPG